MAGPQLENETPFAAQEIILADEEGRDVLVVVVKATYHLPRRGRPLLSEEQTPVDLTGTYHGEPGESSYRFEPEVAPLKLATDVVLVGHAHAGRRPLPQLDVGLCVGAVTKVVRVFGDRWWFRQAGMVVPSDPRPFELMPLLYERAFGGWDRTPEDPAQHTVEARNPVGVGYHHPKWGVPAEGSPLPNLERPDQLITGYADAPAPSGFGFIGPDWLPRRGYAGTYDEAWTRERFPLLPRDFDRWFYSGVPTDQMVPGYLWGNEPVTLFNVVPEGRLDFELPGEPGPTCELRLQDGTTSTRVAPLDTLIIDTDANRVTLLWRVHFPVHQKIHQVRVVRVHPSAGSVFAQRAAPSATT
jgi:hypothetical protein